MQTDEAAALKVAMTYNEHHDGSWKWCSVDKPCVACRELSSLLLRQRGEAVAVATPEIERRAKVEEAERILDLVRSWQARLAERVIVDTLGWEALLNQIAGEIEAEIERLKGETKET